MPLFRRQGGLFDPPKLDITVAHKLGVAKAQLNLGKLLMDLQTAEGDTTLLDPTKTTVTWHGDGSTLEFDTVVQTRLGSFPLSGHGKIAPGYFNLNTSPLPYWTMPFLWYAKNVITDKLTKALAS